MRNYRLAVFFKLGIKFKYHAWLLRGKSMKFFVKLISVLFSLLRKI